MILLKLPMQMQEVVHRVAARGTIDVRVDGPYGYASEPEWTLYDTVVMIAGGIGVSFCHDSELIKAFHLSCSCMLHHHLEGRRRLAGDQFKASASHSLVASVLSAASNLILSFNLQITPLLSMLREIQTQHRQVSVEAKKLDNKQQIYQLPTQVHLIWAVRNRDELQLLDQELLDTAG